jgi:hypothetical protein
MSLATAQRLLAEAVTEAQWQNAIVKAAERCGFVCYHTRFSVASSPGFPDLVCVKPPRVLFVELKTVRGRVSKHQQVWLDLLGDCRGVEVYLWRPSDDWDDISAILQGTQ